MKYEMVLMNSWNIEQYGTSVGEYFDVKMNYRISSNSFRGIYSFQVLPAAATKRGRLLNEGGYY